MAAPVPSGTPVPLPPRHVALALTTHLLRQPPDYPEALALPLPLHRAGLGQQYVLPTRAEDTTADGEEKPPAELLENGDPGAGPDPAEGAAAGPKEAPETAEIEDGEGQPALFGE